MDKTDQFPAVMEPLSRGRERGEEYQIPNTKYTEQVVISALKESSREM